ncbi:hypothetical protein D3C81_1404250 [compost metagenome]
MLQRMASDTERPQLGPYIAEQFPVDFLLLIELVIRDAQVAIQQVELTVSSDITDQV